MCIILIIVTRAPHRQKHGFTLVELLIVIVVIAILATISVVAYNGIQERANAARMASDVQAYIKLLKMYKVDHGSFPSAVSEVFPSPGETCLGEPSEYPADGDMPAGYCLYDVAWAPWRLAASVNLSNSLKVYGSLPKPSMQVNQWGDEKWRGIRYSRGFNFGQEAINILWIVKGANSDYCSIPGTAFVDSSVGNGITYCSVRAH